jgi:hypothetical protein
MIYIYVCRIYDIGVKMARQGVIRVLEKGLHREEGFVPHVIREKAVYAMAWLSIMAPIKHLISTPTMLSGLVKQFSIGTNIYTYTYIYLCIFVSIYIHEHTCIYMYVHLPVIEEMYANNDLEIKGVVKAY